MYNKSQIGNNNLDGFENITFSFFLKPPCFSMLQNDENESTNSMSILNITGNSFKDINDISYNSTDSDENEISLISVNSSPSSDSDELLKVWLQEKIAQKVEREILDSPKNEKIGSPAQYSPKSKGSSYLKSIFHNRFTKREEVGVTFNCDFVESTILSIYVDDHISYAELTKELMIKLLMYVGRMGIKDVFILILRKHKDYGKIL
jgi:hypothetical protein